MRTRISSWTAADLVSERGQADERANLGGRDEDKLDLHRLRSSGEGTRRKRA